jgi:hypothetical protein
VEPVYSDIKIIISAIILIIVSSSNLIETPTQGSIIIRPIVYSNLSTNKTTKFQEKYNKFRILEKDYNKKINIFSNIIKNIQIFIIEN